MNRRQFIAIALASCLTLTGCPTVQQWTSVASALIPIVLQTVEAFTIVNNPLTPQDQANLNAYAAAATTILNDIGADIQAASSATNATLIQKIDAEIAQLKTQTAGVLAALQVKDPGEVAKVTAWVDAILADATDLANLIPVIQGLSSGKVSTTARVNAPVVIKPRTTLAKAASYQDVFKARLAVVKGA